MPPKPRSARRSASTAAAATPRPTPADPTDPILERERRARLRKRLMRKFYGSKAPTARDWNQP